MWKKNGTGWTTNNGVIAYFDNIPKKSKQHYSLLTDIRFMFGADLKFMQKTILILLIFFVSSATVKVPKELPGILEIKEYKLENIDTLVDIGCQNGKFSKEIARIYPNLFLVLEDLESFTICAKGGKKCITHNTHKWIRKTFKNSKKYGNVADRYKFIAGKIDSIPLPSNSSNRVLCRRTLHEFVERDKMVQELKRILSEDGILTIVEAEPNYPNHVDLYCNKRYLTKNEVIDLFKDFRLDSFKTIQYGIYNMNVYNFKKQSR